MDGDGSRKMIWFMAAVLGALGGYIPMLWGAGEFSFSSIIFGGVGALVGIWIGFRLSN